jgi:BirA family biotin operon repressor/biotin-[acetyl-CoA-carboxylase] ligase
MSELTPEAISAGLNTQFIGQRVLCYESVSSTNDLAKQLAEEGAVEGTLVVAGQQTAGRGRHARRWHSSAGSSLLLSLILRPPLKPELLPHLFMSSALAVAQAVEQATSLPVHFKWPNDILLGSKKAGGILIETSLSGEELQFAVIGIGLNVNLDVHDFPEITATATSLSTELGHEASRLEILRSLLTFVEREYLLLVKGESPVARWTARLLQIGEEIEVDTPGGRETGKLQGVDAHGTLLVRRGDGTEARITVGDVR